MCQKGKNSGMLNNFLFFSSFRSFFCNLSKLL